MNPVMRPLVIRHWGQREYLPVWEKMRAHHDARDADSLDEFWLLQHAPVFTMGRNAKAEHLLDPGAIPVVAIDRGGQVTYHGPGQVVLYTLVDLARRKLGIRHLVNALEQTVIALLAARDIEAEAKRDAPGVYVAGAKIAALGLRVSRGRAYHGLSFNVDMDLTPFSQINPCGYKNLRIIDLAGLGVAEDCAGIGTELAERLAGLIGYNEVLSTRATPPDEPAREPLSARAETPALSQIQAQKGKQH